MGSTEPLVFPTCSLGQVTKGEERRHRQRKERTLRLMRAKKRRESCYKNWMTGNRQRIPARSRMVRVGLVVAAGPPKRGGDGVLPESGALRESEALGGTLRVVARDPRETVRHGQAQARRTDRQVESVAVGEARARTPLTTILCFGVMGRISTMRWVRRNAPNVLVLAARHGVRKGWNNPVAVG